MVRTGTVSIIVPCYNAAKFVDDALNSLRQQTYSNLEIIAVNDGSSDDTQQRLEAHAANDPRVRVISQKNRGLPGARNTGLRAMKGEFVGFLDSDDLYLPDKIEKQLSFLQSHPDVDLVYSDNFDCDEKGELIGLHVIRLPDLPPMEVWSQKNWFAPMSSLMRRGLADAVGDFDESFRAAEDWDYWIRCAKIGKFACLPAPLCTYRFHSDQMHRDQSRMYNAGKQLIHKHFRSDPRLYRSALSMFYEKSAKYYWNSGNRAKAAIFLGGSLCYRKLAAISRGRETRNTGLPVRPGSERGRTQIA